MLGRNLRNFLINTLMVVGSLYFTAVSGSFFVGKLASSILLPPETTKQMLNGNVIEVEKNTALKQGYMPIFRPHSFNYSYKLKNISFEEEGIVVGALPFQKAYVCSEGYGTILENLDRMGFRNSDLIWEKIDEIEVMLIGDSMVFGECVKRNQTISDKLISNGILTVSLGIGSNSTGEYAVTQKIFLPNVQPDYLVTVFYPNDRSQVKDNIFFDYLNSPDFLNNYLEKEENSLSLSNKTKQIYLKLDKLMNDKYFYEARFEQLFDWLIDKVIGSRHWRLDGYRPFISELLNSPLDRIDTGSKRVIDLSIENCERYNCTPIFVYIPNDGNFDKNKNAEKYRENLQIYINENDEKLVDTSEILYSSKDIAFSPYSGHLSPKGYSLVGEAIVKAIEAHKELETIQN